MKIACGCCAVRFTAKFGFQLEADTAAAIRNGAAQIVSVSAERIADEMRKMLVLPRGHFALNLLKETQLLRAIWPEWGVLLARASLLTELVWQQMLLEQERLPRRDFALALAVASAPQVRLEEQQGTAQSAQDILATKPAEHVTSENKQARTRSTLDLHTRQTLEALE